MWSKEFCEIERSCNANTQGILEFLITTLADAFHQWQGIVDEKVHMSMLLNYILGELLQHFFVGNIANKVVALLFVYYANRSTCFLELICDAPTYAPCTTCNNDNFIFEIHICICSLNWNL